MAVEKSPFFRPSSNHRMVVVQQRTPPGARRLSATEQHAEEHKSSALGTASNLVNAIVGSGIIGIPYAISKSGFGAGILLILFVALVTEKSLRLLVCTAKHVHVPTYEVLAEVCFGVAGFRFVTINMFIVAYGAMISYLVLVRDSFGSLYIGRFEDEDDMELADSKLVRRTVLLVISLAIMLPLACKRDVADLAQTSRLNVLIDTTLVALIAYNAPIQAAATRAAADPNYDPEMWFHGDTFFVGLGVLSFAFVCQHSSAFIIAGSLNNPTTKRWGMVTCGALSVCVVLAMACGVTGFLRYRDGTKGNILNNLDADSKMGNVARALLGTTMLFVYPLESFVARHACVVLLFSGRAAHEGDDSQILSRRDRRVGLTTALYIAAVVPAALVDDLGTVLAVTGAVGASCLSYIGPGAVYLGVHGERFLQLVRETFGTKHTENSESEEFKHAVETTPLVASGASNIYNGKEVEFGNSINDDILVVNFWKRLVFYFLGMPIWCAIARFASTKVQEHVHDLTMKSLHPIRIGEVEYKRVMVTMSGSNKPGPRPQILEQQHGSNASNMPTSTGGQSINQQIGQGLLDQQHRKESLPSKKLEADPQETPPSWLDFYIAIWYILFGLVALFAGIYSIVT